MNRFVFLTLSLLLGCSGTQIWSGSFDYYANSQSMNAWSWDNQAGPYQTYISGPNSISDWVSIDPSFKNPYDKNTAKGARILVNEKAIWSPGGTELRRTELIPEGFKNTQQKGNIFYQWSMKQTSTNQLLSDYEHQLVFFENHFCDIRYGGNGGATIWFFVNQKNVWNAPFTPDVWQNFALNVNYQNRQVSLYHSINGDALVQVVGPLGTSTPQSDFHLGNLRVPKGNTQTAGDEWIFYSTVSIQDSLYQPFGSNPSSSTPSSPPSSTLYQASAWNVKSFGPYIEGACADKDGNIYAVNYNNVRGSIGKVTPDGTSSMFKSFPDPALFNGIRFDRSGNMFVADVGNTRVLKCASGSTTCETYCSDPSMLYGVPNDLELAANGILYLSGQNWGQDKGELWRCDQNGKATKLDAMGRTNGITLSPDDKTLYLSEAHNKYGSAFTNVIWKYDLSSTGDVSNKRLFVNFTALGSGNVDVDGTRSDADGNLYVTRNGAGQVVKISPSGSILKTITTTFPNPTNLDFGGPDGKTIYVVGQCKGDMTGCFNKFQVETAGRDFVYLHSTSSSTSSDTTVPATTGAKAPMTTGANVPMTTGVKIPSTTGASVPLTTGTNKPMTTGVQLPSTTGRTFPATTGSAPAPPQSPPPQSPLYCQFGEMICTSSSTFQQCNNKADGTTYFAATQYCQPGLSCHQFGLFVYCY